jgi:hypothetical protein
MLIFCIQYDEIDGDHVFTYHCEAKDAREALAEFDKQCGNYRVLSIELIPRDKVNDFEYRFKAERQMRDRVIECLTTKED